MRQDFFTMPAEPEARARTVIMPGGVCWRASENGAYWETKCPHCKRGVLFQFKTNRRPAAVKCQLSACAKWTEAP